MRNLFAAFLFLVVGLAFVQPVQSQDTPKPVAGAMDTNKDGKVDAKETAAEIEKDAGVGDVVKDVTAVVDAATDLKTKKSGTSMSLMIMALLGTIFKLLLSGIKMIKSQTKWFHAKKAKRIVKYTTLGLGAAAALMANLVFGMGWMEAAIILMSGPLSVAIHEYTKDSKDGPPDA